VLSAIEPITLRLELGKRVEEVGECEASIRPTPKVDVQRLEVGSIMREKAGENGELLADSVDEGASQPMMIGAGDAAILHLECSEFRYRSLEGEPRWLFGHATDGTNAKCVSHWDQPFTQQYIVISRLAARMPRVVAIGAGKQLDRRGGRTKTQIRTKTYEGDPVDALT